MARRSRFLTTGKSSLAKNTKFEPLEKNTQLELKIVKNVLISNEVAKENVILKIVDNISSFNKIIRIVSYVYRLIRPLKTPKV